MRTVTAPSPPQDEDGNSHVSEKDRAAVRQLIVELMLRSPEQVQRQLSDAISVIGRCDFPARWPNLIGDLTSRFSSGQCRAGVACYGLSSAHVVEIMSTRRERGSG